MIPVQFDDANIMGGFLDPNAVTVSNTKLTAFYRRYLLQKAMSVFKWDFPKDWKKQDWGIARYFLYTLYVCGTVAIINTDKYGIIPQYATLSGYNLFYQPKYATIENPLINGEKRLQINRECGLFTMTTDYCGIYDLVNYYASMMALVSEGMAVNTLNSKLSYMFAADDKATAETMKRAADKVLSGSPFVVVGKNLFDSEGKPRMSLFAQNLAQNFIAPQQMELLNKIENQFATEIGLPNCNDEKRERMVVDEVNANNVETMTRCDMWLEGWKDSCKRANELFNIDISVDWRIKPQEVKTDGAGNIDNPRAV